MIRVCINGAVLEPEGAKVSALDYGFLYGFGLFETLRVYKGKPFALKEHLERMEGAAREIGWDFPWDLRTVREWVSLTIEPFGEVDLRLRLTATPGRGEPIADPSTCREPTLVIIASELPRDFDRRIERGLKVVLFPHPRGSFASRLKSLSYIESVLARSFAREKKAHEALFVNHRGIVTEGATSNVFVILERALLTPPLELELLDGITRKFVISLALEMGLRVREEEFGPDAFHRCEGAFLTNSVMEVAPILSFEGRSLPQSPLVPQLRKAYREMVLSRVGSELPHRGLEFTP
ncbi:MAG TPA: hypothetical protein EYP65_04140 [Armatimonadetes bacterium]|nr:hypothetical protein [Armatimonadota bacterium]